MVGVGMIRRLLQRVSPRNLQEAALAERCIVVNERDQVVGDASKRDCHRVNSDGSLILHRAFSVFLFNSRNELLLQKRSPQKVTFPSCITNTCCSHPLHEIAGEREETDTLGVRRAAGRRLNYELGVPLDQVSPEQFQYLTRIHYRDPGDGKWGEHEIDYILVLHRDVSLDPNPDEVSEVQYVGRDQLDSFLASQSAPLTPWFRLIAQHHLQVWWDNLHQLHKFQDHSSILRFC
ncbi:isopentenyl-diphosphate Delta-isomerase 1 [Periplaneta americana]|uniref:isopentenyl-diphosphate Delta-isomerase 1 n=1 Tax=Periplaneta americana TaxID=6978 RepID=UPI0037E970C0